MKIFNIDLTLTKNQSEYGAVENYPVYVRKKMLQLLIMIAIYVVLFYTLSYFSKALDKLNNISPPALHEEIIHE